MDVMQAPEQAQHVRTFVKLANLTQTSQLHEWNLESLQRALEWARAAEDAVSGGDTQQEIDMRIRQWFPVATLPTLPIDGALTADALRHARIHLLRSILQSPFLALHPTRSELLVAVLQELRSRREDASYSSVDEAEEHASNSALMVDRVTGTPRTEAMLAIARRMSEGYNHIRVQVLLGWVSIPPFKSFALSPRTLQLKAMAKTLQRNAVDARAAVNPETYRGFLSDLRSCFEEPESKDVREVVVLMVVMCEWPKEEPPQLRGMVEDLVKVVRDWVTSKPIRFWTFQPWLAAMLAGKSNALASAYVSELFKTGLLQPWEGEFAARVATLSLQGAVVEVVLKPALRELDPHLLETYFKVE
ncbi:nadph-dependent diflavin [Phytophthora cinnamomi]|uniref:nadph-dependent diflavin n=1 Tax=Phytophthora cinnamomi TaxID=4785 RepID=UPI00355A8EE2|nr:nadph-dependent diflavin [Phytophthora cinnamomi]